MTVNLLAALFDMSAFVLVAGGDKMFVNYSSGLMQITAYISGLCHAVGSISETNVGLIYALQRAVGIPANVANGNFGDATNAALKSVSLAVGSTGLLVKIVKYGLYLNSMYGGDF